MCDFNLLKDIAAVAPLVSAVAACIVAGMAVNAARIWKLTLKQQRADECMSAARDLSGALDHLLRVKIKENLTHKEPIKEAYDELLASWRRFDQAFGIACRYYKTLDKSISKQVRWQIENLDDVLMANWGSVDSVGRQQGQGIAKFIDDFLRPAHQL